MEKRITGHTTLLALIGSPVGHSGSPEMYNEAFQKLGLDYAYVAFDVKEDQVKQAIDAMKLFHMRGMNVTMPDKTEAAKYMDELSPAAKIIGAVNTIVNDDGKLTGHMTDGEGFVNNLRAHGVDVKDKKLVVAGGGGAATAIQVQSALDGARELTIFNKKDAFFQRTLDTAEKIRNAVPGIVVNVYDIDDIQKMTEEIRSADIFANATIVGMKPMDDQSVVKDLAAFYPGLVVADAVYNPEETKLLREAKAAGCTVVSGRGMLFWQGVSAFRLYTGQEMPMKKHLFLVGFMGAGKSAAAKILAKKQGCKLVEMDQRIEEEEKMSINEIFEKYGEEHFRDIESRLIRKLGAEEASVISCGGGAVLREENIEFMKKYGTVVYLSARPETIYQRVRHSKTRPVLNGHMNVEYIGKLMEKRRGRYEKAADVTIETDDKSLEEICEEILRRSAQ